MATLKQMKMLAARCKAAGMKYVFEDFKALENGEVDEKLEEIKEYQATYGGVPKKKQPAETAQIDGIRFGMACKLVIQQRGIDWAFANKEFFEIAVKRLYERLQQAEEAVKSASSSSPDNQDALAEATYKRQIEHRKVV